MKEKNYITHRGLKKLQRELHHLQHHERPEVTKVVAWAASLGDRSENADYQYGKKRLREIDRRIHFLRMRIELALAVEPTSVNAEKIQFGATVTIENEDGEQKKLSIVGVDEINLEKGLISWKSPLGSALLGKEEGDDIQVHTPKGRISYQIICVEYIELEID